MQHTSAPVSKSQGEMCPFAFTLINGLFGAEFTLAKFIDKIENKAPIQVGLLVIE